MRIIFVFLALLIPSSEAHGQPFDYGQNDRTINFKFFYPHVFLDDSQPVARRNRGVAAGVGFDYQFFANSKFGFSILPVASFIPVKISGNARTLYLLSFEGGVIYRPLSRSYLDPWIEMGTGVGRALVGAGIGSKIYFPIRVEVGANVWRESNPFKDYRLAMCFFAALTYQLQELILIDPWMLSAGIAFRGAF